jgi:hypothetical protein
MLSLYIVFVGLQFGLNLISWCGSVQQPPAPQMLSYSASHLIDNASDMVYDALPLQIFDRNPILGQDGVRFLVSN